MESLTDQEMKDGEDYVFKYDENLEGAREHVTKLWISTEHEEDAKTVQKGYLRIVKWRIVA